MVSKKPNRPRQRPERDKKGRPGRRKAAGAQPGGRIIFDSGPLPDDVLDGPIFDSGPLPDDILGGAFFGLDKSLPLLLLPVRIETRYLLDADPPELRIRIYPDQIHIDADRPQPSKGEVKQTQDFWRQWYSAKDEAHRKADWQQFVQQAGAKRAGYLARIMRPTSGKDGDLVFPAPPADSTKPTPAHPALLPHRWLAIGYGVSGNQIFLKASLPVAEDLRTGPDPESPSWAVDGGGLEVDAGLAWMIDYERAVQAGMAITIPLTGPAAEATDQVQVLLVLGVANDLDPQAASAELARLLDVHARTSGLAFVPQGTPTNNTEDTVSGWTYAEEEVAALGERLFKDLPKAPPSVFEDNAAQLASAFGFSDSAFLRRLAHGTDREAVQSKNMRAVLFEAVMGTLLQQLLHVGGESGLSTSAINAARDWFIENVRGGAPLPTLRVGPQPYGILPVRRAAANPDAANTAGQVERIIDLLIDVWRESIQNVPTLVERSTTEDPQAEIETAVASILAAQPHPARIFTRQMDEYIEDETPIAIQNTYHWYIDMMFSPVSPEAIREVGGLYYTMSHEYYPTGVKNIEEQLDLWTKIYDRLDQLNNNDGRDFIELLLSNLESYEKRQRPLRWLGLNPYEGVLGDDENTKIIAGALWGTAGEWDEAGLTQAANPGPGQTTAEYLAELKSRSEAGDLELSDWSPKPLLYQLIELTMGLVPKVPAVQAKFQQALASLAGLDPEQLDWLTRETLGLGSHRLDAWFTSLASDRLNKMRRVKPTGLQIGAFGWVMSLRPRRKKRSSEGFIHAPSLAHAATAALLRAGYLAHGSSDRLSPVAVDIRSAQVRAASWLLDGVRQGQPLGDLLGYHFERSLHDREADVDIQVVRQMVLNAQGKPNAPSYQPVDGIELLDLYRSKQIQDADLSAKAKAAIADLEQAFDAVYDVSLYESVHQLTAGNFERATAMMDSISVGTIDPPELRAPLTPRSAVAVEHRVVILLRPDAAVPNRGWKIGIRDRLAPALEGWAASLLPHAGNVGFQVTPILPDGQLSASSPMTLAQLELSALDAVYLAGDDPLVAAAALQTLAAGAAGAGGPVHINPNLSDTEFSLADFTVVASELRRLLEALRPLDARDLRPADQRGEPDTDLSAGQSAIAALLASFETMGAKFCDPLVQLSPQNLSAIVTGLARLGISVGSSPHDLTAVEVLKQIVQRRMANIAKIERDAANPLPGLETKLAALLGRRIPVLGQFHLAGSAGGPVVNVSAGPVRADKVDDWLDAAGRVRADVGKLTTLGMLSELMGNGGLSLQVGQHPLEPGEGWAAAQRPAGAGRLSVVAVSGPGGPPAVGQPACGLLADQWSESVPVDRQVTGLTLQYDAPSNRPPQAWLLAVPPEGEAWNLKLVTDTLLQTLEWSALRAVGPEHLVDYGRAIPTTFVPGNILNWPVERAA